MPVTSAPLTRMGLVLLPSACLARLYQQYG